MTDSKVYMNDSLRREIKNLKQQLAIFKAACDPGKLDSNALAKLHDDNYHREVEPPVIAVNLGLFGTTKFPPAIIAGDPTLIGPGEYGYTIDMRTLGYEGLAHIKVVIPG